MGRIKLNGRWRKTWKRKCDTCGRTEMCIISKGGRDVGVRHLKMEKPGLTKGWTRIATYRSKKKAQERANKIRHRFRHCVVQKGTKGKAWGDPKTCYRVWAK